MLDRLTKRLYSFEVLDQVLYSFSQSLYQRDQRLSYFVVRSFGQSPFCDNTVSLSSSKLSHAFCKLAPFEIICQETSVVPAILSTNTPRSLSFRLLGSLDCDKTRASHGRLFGVVQFCRWWTDTLNDTTAGRGHKRDSYRGHHCSKNSHIRVTKHSLMHPIEELAETSAQS